MHEDRDRRRRAICWLRRRLAAPLGPACLLALVVLPRQLSLPLRAARHPCLLLVPARLARGRTGRGARSVSLGFSGFARAREAAGRLASASPPVAVRPTKGARADHRLPRRRLRHELLRRRARPPARSASWSTRASRCVDQLDEVLARAPAAAGRGAAHARPHRPHLLGHAGLRRPRHPGVHPPGRRRRCSPTRSAGSRRRPRPCSAAGWRGPSRTTCRPLADGEVLDARRAGDHRRPRPGPHPRVGDVPAARTTTDRARGDAVRRRAVRRLHRPHRPARRRHTPRCCAASPRKVLPLRDEVVVLPGHGPQTTIGRERATNPFLQGLPRPRRRRRRGL